MRLFRRKGLILNVHQLRYGASTPPVPKAMVRLLPTQSEAAIQFSKASPLSS
jgi:hypothetical protein